MPGDRGLSRRQPASNLEQGPLEIGRLPQGSTQRWALRPRCSALLRCRRSASRLGSVRIVSHGFVRCFT